MFMVSPILVISVVLVCIIAMNCCLASQMTGRRMEPLHMSLQYKVTPPFLVTTLEAEHCWIIDQSAQ